MMPLHPTHKVTVSRQTKPTSGFGGAAPFSAVYTDILCCVYQASGNEAVIYEGDRSVSFGTARFQAGYAIQSGDRIGLTGGDTLEIIKTFTRYRGMGIPFRVDCEWGRVQA